VETSDHISEGFHPKVYAYTEPQYAAVPWEDDKGAGLLKVGYTTAKDAEHRVRSQYGTKRPTAVPYDLVLVEDATTEAGGYFTDHDVHRVLVNDLDRRRVNGEWFECTADDVRAAVEQLRNGTPARSRRLQRFRPRPEQAAAVAATADYFRQQRDLLPGRAPHFLWNAKMRFGKTFAAYQLAKEMGWTRILVLTFKPAVQSAWGSDLKNHEDFRDWQFIGGRQGFEGIDETRPFVWFASFQDMLQKTKDGRIKPRHEETRLIDWDCVILDEFHFGAHRAAARELYDAEPQEAKAADTEFDEDTCPLSVKHYLYLSGTPFRALANGEFTEDQIFNWTYTDEQRAKRDWDESNGPNPYAELPKMVMLTYRMPDELRQIAKEGEFDEFDLNEFFRAVSEEDGTGGVVHRFVHETEVLKWLDLLRGQYLGSYSAARADGERPPIPFEDRRLRAHLAHTLWFLPNVAACEAMGALLRAHGFYREYTVVVAAGDKAGMGMAALPPVEEAITRRPTTSLSITLTCSKLTTGVTVPAWSGIFMLRNTTSPETYFQAAFRVQSPWVVTQVDPERGGERREILKDTCYVLDFAPTRALSLITEYTARLDDGASRIEQRVHDFLGFLPVLCFDGSHMVALDADELLDFVAVGTGATMLARRWQSALLVNVDTATLEKLLANAEVVAALENMEAFRKLKLSEGLARSVAAERDIKKTRKDGDAPNKEQEAGERESKKFRQKLREQLIKFATRVPVFMYLTDFREENLKDVITRLEPDLFKRVTNLTVDDFQALCDIGVFNEQAMNSAIFQFRRFELGSLSYAGNSAVGEFIGGFNTVATTEEVVAGEV
jgi:hypothetical protein